MFAYNQEPESRMSYPIEKKFVVAVSSTVTCFLLIFTPTVER